MFLKHNKLGVIRKIPGPATEAYKNKYLHVYNIRTFVFLYNSIDRN